MYVIVGSTFVIFTLCMIFSLFQSMEGIDTVKRRRRVHSGDLGLSNVNVWLYFVYD